MSPPINPPNPLTLPQPSHPYHPHVFVQFARGSMVFHRVFVVPNGVGWHISSREIQPQDRIPSEEIRSDGSAISHTSAVGWPSFIDVRCDQRGSF